MERRCKQICSCLSDSKDLEDIKRQAYRVVECSFYTKKTAPSFLNHCFANKDCQNGGKQGEWRTRCENECQNNMPTGKMKVQRCCHAAFPIPSYKAFECDAKGDACTVRNDAHLTSPGVAPASGTAPVAGTAPASGTAPVAGTASVSGTALVAGTAPTSGESSSISSSLLATSMTGNVKEVPKVDLSEDVDKMMTLKGFAACVTKEAAGEAAIDCPVRKVRNCQGEWEDEIVLPTKELRCKELCPHEIVPLKKRQVYAKCGGMIPGYGGHVPGYTICTLGNSYSMETEGCLKRVISNERLDSIVRKCKLADTKIIFVVGGPGSGKGTQCDMLRQRFNLTHLSSGDLLRAEVDSGSALGESLSATMASGRLVSMETVLDILEAAVMKALKAGTKGFLIDGYPREVDQGLMFARKIRDCDVVLFFDAKDETMTSRLLKRALTSGRADDNYTTVKLRLKTFHDQTRPVVDFYRQRGKLIRVNADRQPQVIFKETETKLIAHGI